MFESQRDHHFCYFQKKLSFSRITRQGLYIWDCCLGEIQEGKTFWSETGRKWPSIKKRRSRRRRSPKEQFQKCSHRLVWSRTPPFHGGNRGSNPLGSTKFERPRFRPRFFFACSQNTKGVLEQSNFSQKGWRPSTINENSERAIARPTNGRSLFRRRATSERYKY